MSVVNTEAVDLFAGPGGWDVAATELGIRVTGIEWSHDACETRRAAGLPTIEGDVRAYGPKDFPTATTLIGSPPCQTFSMAGKGAGRQALDAVITLAETMARRETIDLSSMDDERTGLVLEPLRWALDAIDLGSPYATIILEQVPTVLPVWDAFAEILRAEGYSVVTDRLTAEQYGVPQTRKRAILVAQLHGTATLPTPTHRKYRKGAAQHEGDPALLPWVSMADVLDRPEPFEAISNYGTGGDPKNRGVRRSDEPFATVTSKIDRFKLTPAGQARNSGPGAKREPRSLRSPSYTIRANGSGSHPSGTEWVCEEGSVRVLPEEAAILQSFPVGYPWRGTKTRIYQQIGNAVPPVLAHAVLSSALS